MSVETYFTPPIHIVLIPRQEGKNFAVLAGPTANPDLVESHWGSYNTYNQALRRIEEVGKLPRFPTTRLWIHDHRGVNGVPPGGKAREEEPSPSAP